MTRSVVIRKLFHATVLGALAATTYFWGKRIGIFAGSGLLALSIASEIARRHSVGLARFLEGPARGVIKENEKKRIVASTYAALGSLLVLIVFSQASAVLAISLLAIGDPAAFLFGKAFGSKPGKTKEGSLGCFGSCSALCYLIFGLAVWEAVLLGITAALAEVAPVVDDNISIPILAGAVAELLKIGF
jgi:dolichol kinase